MPSFSDVASSLILPSCCMRKNPTPIQRVQDDVTMLSVTFAVYITSYLLGWNSLCLLSMAALNMAVFQIGVNYRALHEKEIHLNQFDELDVSTSSESSSAPEELSLKQREQGATVSKALSLEQEDKLNRQLQQVVKETSLRNRKRAGLNTPRTPSSSTLIDDVGVDTTQYPPVPPSDNEDEYAGMPALVPQEESNPIIRQAYKTPNNTWSEVPNFSQTHYLHAFDMDELD